MIAWGLAALMAGWRPGGGELVEVRAVCPGIRVELRYATPHNGTGRALYPPGSHCLLRRSVAERLWRVQERLARRGLSLKVWDAYRPLSAQRALWAAMPDRRFVALPRRGSKHNRGAAVDVTLVDAHGAELPMPTDFDAFNGRARPSFGGSTAERRRHRDLLRRAMMAEGFIPDAAEWWHFSAPDWRRYRLLDIPLR